MLVDNERILIVIIKAVDAVIKQALKWLRRDDI
jgi:hypothetical protein